MIGDEVRWLKLLRGVCEQVVRHIVALIKQLYDVVSKMREVLLVPGIVEHLVLAIVLVRVTVHVFFGVLKTGQGVLQVQLHLARV